MNETETESKAAENVSSKSGKTTVLKLSSLPYPTSLSSFDLNFPTVF